MTDLLQIYLPICIYILLIILLVIGIVLGVRLIGAMNKVDSLLSNVEKKINSLNSFFSVIDFTTDKISALSDRIVDLFTGLISRIGRKKSSVDIDDDDEDF